MLTNALTLIKSLIDWPRRRSVGNECGANCFDVCAIILCICSVFALVPLFGRGVTFYNWTHALIFVQVVCLLLSQNYVQVDSSDRELTQCFSLKETFFAIIVLYLFCFVTMVVWFLLLRFDSPHSRLSLPPLWYQLDLYIRRNDCRYSSDFFWKRILTMLVTPKVLEDSLRN